MGKRQAPGTGPESLPCLPAQPPAGKGELAVSDAPSRARGPRATRTCVEPPGPAPPPLARLGGWRVSFPSNWGLSLGLQPTPKGEAIRGLRWGPEGRTGLDSPEQELRAGCPAEGRVGPGAQATPWHRWGSVNTVDAPDRDPPPRPPPSGTPDSPRSQVAPVSPGGHRQWPVTGSQGTPSSQSHCRLQPSPNEPGSHPGGGSGLSVTCPAPRVRGRMGARGRTGHSPFSQNWPRKPAGQRHLPLTGSQGAPC